MRQRVDLIPTTTTGPSVRRTVWIGVLFVIALLYSSNDLSAQGTRNSQSLNLGPGQPRSSDKWYSRLMPWKKDSPASKSKVPSSRKLTTANEPSEKVKSEGQLSFARLAERRGQPEQAKTIYLAFIEQHRDNPLPFHRLGVMAAAEGNYEACDEFLSMAFHLDERNPDLLADIGYSMYLRGHEEDAETFYRRALEVSRDHEAAANNLGILLAETGRQSESLALFKRVNDEAEAYANQGYILAQTGDLEQAEQYFSHALTIDTTLKPAAIGLLQVAEHQRNRDSLPEFARDSKLAELAANTNAPSNRQQTLDAKLRDKASPTPPEVVIKDRERPTTIEKPRTAVDIVAQSPPAVTIQESISSKQLETPRTTLVNRPTLRSPVRNENPTDQASDTKNLDDALATVEINDPPPVMGQQDVSRPEPRSYSTFNALAHRPVDPAAKPVSSVYTTRLSDTPETIHVSSDEEGRLATATMRVATRWGATPVSAAVLTSEVPSLVQSPSSRSAQSSLRPHKQPLWIKLDGEPKPVISDEDKAGK